MYRFFLKHNDEVLGPFNATEMVKIEPSPETLISEGNLEEWRASTCFDFNLLSQQEVKENTLEKETIPSGDVLKQKIKVSKAKLFLKGLISTGKVHPDSSTEVEHTISLSKSVRIMNGWGYDVANDSNLTDYQKGYLIHALEEYCNSNFQRPFTLGEKKLIARLNESYHIANLVAQIKKELELYDYMEQHLHSTWPISNK